MLSVKTLKQIIQDYNYWGQSESDSPLKIRRAKGVLDNKKILAYDASMRLEAAQANAGTTEVTYTVPANRTIEVKTLSEVFEPLASSALQELSAVAAQTTLSNITNLTMSAEALEYYLQLYSAFKEAPTAKVCYVNAGEPQVSMFIIGENSGESIVAYSLLIQT